MDEAHPTRVVVGVDTSLSGLQALRLAVDEARRRDATLHAVRTWEPAPSDPGSPEMSGTHPRGTLAAAAAGVICRAFAETMGGEPDDVAVHTVVVPDAPGPVLVGYACRDRDLLVLGAGGRGLLRRLWGNSVVRYCVTRAACPVLVVPPPPLTRAGSPRALLRELRRDLDHLSEPGPDPPT